MYEMMIDYVLESTLRWEVAPERNNATNIYMCYIAAVASFVMLHVCEHADAVIAFYRCNAFNQCLSIPGGETLVVLQKVGGGWMGLTTRTNKIALSVWCTHGCMGLTACAAARRQSRVARASYGYS